MLDIAECSRLLPDVEYNFSSICDIYYWFPCYFLYRESNSVLNILVRAVTIRRDWFGWLDLFQLCTRLVTASYTALGFSVFTCRFLATDFNTVIISITVTAAHMKSSLHSLIPFLPSLLNHLRMPSQETPSILLPAGLGSSFYSVGADPTESTVSTIIDQQYLDCLLLIRCRGDLLPSHCLAMNVYSGSAIPAFRYQVTLLLLWQYAWNPGNQL
jgi:hypothetical protein